MTVKYGDLKPGDVVFDDYDRTETVILYTRRRKNERYGHDMVELWFQNMHEYDMGWTTSHRQTVHPDCEHPGVVTRRGLPV